MNGTVLKRWDLSRYSQSKGFTTTGMAEAIRAKNSFSDGFFSALVASFVDETMRDELVIFKASFAFQGIFMTIEGEGKVID